MKRPWPWWTRVLLSVCLAVLLQWPYAGWHWDVQLRKGKGLLSLSPTGEIFRHKSAMSIITSRLYDLTIQIQPALPTWLVFGRLGWNLTYILATALLPAVIGLMAYLYLTERFGPPPDGQSETRCRKCRHILFGLSAPRCPECGEPI